MKAVVFEFDEGVAIVLHNDERAASLFLSDTYGLLPNLTHKFSIAVGPQPPKIMCIRGSIVLSQNALIAQRTKDIASDVFDFKAKVPSIDTGEEDYDVVLPPPPQPNPDFDNF
jgi:hypothetical protein